MSPMIRCECSYGGEEGMMVSTLSFHGLLFLTNECVQVKCNCCGALQHQHCYALELIGIGAEHVCYACLMTDEESELLGKMTQVTELRRAFWLINTGPYPASSATFADKLGELMRWRYQWKERLIDKGCTVKNVSSIESKLKKEGLVADAPAKSKKRSDKSKHPKVVVHEGITASQARPDGLLNPLAFIGGGMRF